MSAHASRAFTPKKLSRSSRTRTSEAMSAHASRAFAPKKLPQNSRTRTSEAMSAHASRAFAPKKLPRSRRPSRPFFAAAALHPYPKEAGAAATRADVEMFFVKSRHADEGIAALCPGGVTQSWRINSRQTPQAPPLPFPTSSSRNNELGHAHDRRRQRIRHLRRKHVAKRAHVFDELFVDVVLFVVEPVRGDRLVAPRDGGRRR